MGKTSLSTQSQLNGFPYKSNRDWVVTNPSNFQAVAITAYEICGKKFIGYPTEYTLLVHTNKFCNREWFSRLQKVDHMTN